MENSIEEGEDLITCIVCFLEYDEEVSKPKFLACSHSVCSKCLEGMYKDKKFACPMCRKDTPAENGISDLPTNVYALYMLRAKKKAIEENALHGVLCLTCGCEAKVSCTRSHSIVHNESGEIFENDKKLLRALVEKYKNWLMEEIAKRTDMETFFQRTSRHLEKLLDDIKERCDDNDIRMAELFSILDTLDSWDY